MSLGSENEPGLVSGLALGIGLAPEDRLAFELG
jgi:hypothetical protein